MSTSSAKDQFVHLHVHTEYSMLDGAARVGDLFEEASRLGMPAVAMTDHGNVYGAYDFWKRGKEAGVKAIIGMEGYYAPQGRHERSRFDFGGGYDEGTNEIGESGGNIGREAYTHMTLLSETTEGMHNLFRLSSLASLEGFYHKPRFDRELLQQYGKGIIATTGCPSGEVNRWLLAGNYERAREAAADFRDILGAENFYCELMDHNIAVERAYREDLLKIARDLGLPLIATNDLHYVRQEDHEAHDVLLCIGTRATVDDPKRFRFTGDQFYLKSAEEMRRLWSELPEACDNTLAIAERCNVEFNEGADLMPVFPVPAGESEESWLVKEVERGLNRRFNNEVPEEHRKQAAYEVDVMCKMGFPGYFLVTADLVQYAHEQGIRVGPGRGSAAGSLVAYALGITELDPIRHGLLFERFLNPERISMPDIDMDFDERRRSDMIRYATEKYGSDRVAQIVTYGSIKAKAAIKDSARALNMPYALGDKINKAMPPAVMGKDVPLSELFNKEHGRYKEGAEFRALYDAESDVRQVVDTAKGLEGLKRQPGVHAAGVILCKEPLLDVVPIWKREQDGSVITQFDMGACESLGLLKMDFLGLRNLTVLDDCLEAIKINTDNEIILEDLPLEDEPTYKLLSRGDTLGVFQLDGGPMRALLKSMAPDNFEDISAVLALYRPGPMGANAHNDYADRKNGRKPVEPIHPELAEPLEEILGDTYGLIVYQEQVMAIAQVLAGYSLGSADLLRRAMGKKKKEILDKEYIPFHDGMIANGYSEDAIKKLWEILVPFSDYAFNKAHTAGYGLVSYWTAYLKANYPAEFMAALLTSTKDDKDKSAIYLNECRRMGIQVLQPDVNESQANFAASGDKIRFGMTAVRNVGANVVESIIQARESKGAFVDFKDFLDKIDLAACNKRVIESLIKSGAFDSFGVSRRALSDIHVEAVESMTDLKRSQAAGQFDLFGGDSGASGEGDLGLGITIDIEASEWPKSVLLAKEREMLGLYVSDHPLNGVEVALRSAVEQPISSLLGDDVESGRTFKIGGLITSVQRKVTKRGDQWAMVELEDLDSRVNIMVFPKAYQQVSMHLREDAVVLVKGRLDKSEDEETKFIAQEFSPLDLEQTRLQGPVIINLTSNRVIGPVVDELKGVLSTHPGVAEVQLKVNNSGKITTVRLPDQLRVSPTPSLFADLKALLGPSCLPTSSSSEAHV